MSAYNPREFPPFAVTVDIVVFSVVDTLSVLLIDRGVEPFKGSLALPGGFVTPNESVHEAAWRELSEETGVDESKLSGMHLEQLGTYGGVARDPRMRVVSVAYLTLSPTQPTPVAGTDAATAQWVAIDDALASDLAFDHAEILVDAVERAKAKLEYTTLAATLAGNEFTLGELQEVYEIVWGVKLERANFRRKVLASPGFVVQTKKRRSGKNGGAPGAVYRRGNESFLNNPIRRSYEKE